MARHGCQPPPNRKCCRPAALIRRCRPVRLKPDRRQLVVPGCAGLSAAALGCLGAPHRAPPGNCAGRLCARQPRCVSGSVGLTQLPSTYKQLCSLVSLPAACHTRLPRRTHGRTHGRSAAAELEFLRMPPEYGWKASFTAFNARYPAPQASREQPVTLRCMCADLAAPAA